MTMTRETKVGVVVCLSFLCLVGIVLGTKLRGGSEEDELALKEEIIAEPQPVGPAENPPPMRIPTRSGDGATPQVIQRVAVQDAQPLPPPPSTANPIGHSAETSSGPVMEMPPPPTTKETAQPVTGTVSGLPAPDDVAWESSDSDAGPRLLVSPANVRALLLWGAIRTPLAPDVAAPSPAPPPVATNQSSPPDVPAPTTTAAESKDRHLPAATIGNEQDPLARVENLQSSTTTGNTSPNNGLPAQVRGANPSGESATTSPSAGAKTTKRDEISLAMNPPPSAGQAPSATLLPPTLAPGGASRADAGTAGVVPDRVQTTTATADVGQQPRQPAPSQPVVQVSGTDNPRRVGEAPTATTPPIAVPGPGTGSTARPAAPTTPQVESYDEETYRIKAGDSFDRISVAHFNTDKYAKALERWNASHPQAHDNLRSNPPLLEPGQALFIPPAYMLEKRYGSLVPGYKPSAPAQPAPTNDAGRTSNSSPRGETAANAAPNFKWYLVSPNGQTMREIARTTLDNPERWADISKLNPAVQPEFALRGGLLIKVPADARIPPANVPQTASR